MWISRTYLLRVVALELEYYKLASQIQLVLDVDRQTLQIHVDWAQSQRNNLIDEAGFIKLQKYILFQHGHVHFVSERFSFSSTEYGTIYHKLYCAIILIYAKFWQNKGNKLTGSIEYHQI